jgi:hypothetical protein
VEGSFLCLQELALRWDLEPVETTFKIYFNTVFEISASTPFSQTPSRDIVALGQNTKLHTHTKQWVNLYVIFIR